MVMRAVLGTVAQLVVTGLAAALAFDGVKRVARGPVVRATAVAAATWGLRGVRAAEIGAEQVRLAAADIVSEARERHGEQSQPRDPGAGHDDHEH